MRTQASRKQQEQDPIPPLAALDKKDFPSISELRKAIPEHCFRRSNARSLALVGRDGAIIFALAYFAWFYLPTTPDAPGATATATGTLAWLLSWNAYWFVQGCAMTGWWVLAHECGHRGFAESSILCDVVGYILHSFLLVPYFSWQYSHGKHHAKTSHLSDGETHIASIQKDSARDRWLHAVLGEDAFAIVQMVVMLTIGWPVYLCTGITGARRDPKKRKLKAGTLRDHFRPSSALFPTSGAWDKRILASNVGLLMTVCGLCFVGVRTNQPLKVFMLYFPAYLWVNCWLVLYTWLHHVSTQVPQLGDDEWTWIRGALCTIDRPYPFLIDWMHHHIGSTHVAHHLFSNIPCYHAAEATVALKQYLSPKGLYNYDDRSILQAMWSTAHECHYVESENGVQMWRKWRSK